MHITSRLSIHPNTPTTIEEYEWTTDTVIMLNDDFFGDFYLFIPKTPMGDKFLEEMQKCLSRVIERRLAIPSKASIPTPTAD